ncbi:aldo/keto reductase [Cupriavidus sp. Marseille-Q8015]
MSMDRRTFLGLTGVGLTGVGLTGALALPRAYGATAEAATVAAPMRRKLPGSTEALPVIGMGTADTFNVGRSAEERAPLAEVMSLLLRDAPGGVVDTAPSYGSAEGVTGDLLQTANARTRVFLATKISTSHASAPAQFSESLAALHADTIDLLQVHNLIDWRENLRWMRQLKEARKVRYIGITHYRDDAHEQLAQILRSERVDFLQVNYSLAERNAEKVLLPLAQERGVAVLINRPFQDGRMFSAVRGKTIPDWAGEIDCNSWGQLFLKFIVSHPAVTAAIPATSKPRNMADNLGAGFGRMPDARERGRIAALLA